MAEKTKILELDIDVESIIAKSAQLKSELDGLRVTQDNLKKSGDTNSEAFVKNAANITKLSSEYNVNQKQLTGLIASNGEFASIQDKANALLAKEVTGIKEAATSNKELKVIRDSLNLTRADEKALADEINDKLNKNTDFIKANVSENEKLKIGIGGYKDAVKDAIGETGIYTGELGNVAKVYDAASKAVAPFVNDIKATAENMKSSTVETEGMSVAQKGLTIATNLGSGAMRIFALAVAATGVGAIIIVIALLINYFRQLDPVMDKVEQLFAGVGGAIDAVTNIVGDFVTNLKSASDFIGKMGSILAHPIDSFKSLGKEMASAAEEAANLKERQQDLADQMDINSILNKKQESEIGRLLIQAKDKSKSDAETNKAFADAEKLNAEIFERNKKASTEGLEIAIVEAKKKKKLTEDEIEDLRNLDIAKANTLLNEGKITTESYNQLKTAFESKIDVENQYNEQLDKITTKSNNAIEKQQAANEAAAKKTEEAKQKILDDAAALSTARLNLFLSEQGIRVKSLEEDLRLNEEILNKKLEIAQKEFEASKKTQADKIGLLAAENEAKNEFLQKQTDLVVENAQHELDIYLDTHKSKIEANKFLTEELLNQEKERLDGIAKEQQEFEQLRLTNGVITEQEYQDAIKQVQDDTRVAKEEAQAERDQAEADRKIADIENQLATSQSDFDKDLALKIERLNLQKAAELKNANDTGADKTIIIAKYTGIEKQLRNDVEQSKLALISSGLSQAKGLFKENTAAYKILAVAEATINTYKAASMALSTYAYPIGGIFAGLAIAQGLIQVSQIVGVKLAKGAIDLNGPGSTTSDSIPAQLSRGESVINAESTAKNKSLLQAINTNSGVDFAKQVFPSSVANIYNNNQQQPMDYDLLASKISEANKSLPAPNVKVGVDDIQSGLDSKQAIVDGANF